MLEDFNGEDQPYRTQPDNGVTGHTSQGAAVALSISTRTPIAFFEDFVEIAASKHELSRLVGGGFFVKAVDSAPGSLPFSRGPLNRGMNCGSRQVDLISTDASAIVGPQCWTATGSGLGDNREYFLPDQRRRECFCRSRCSLSR
jgi:hypothetical protein